MSYALYVETIDADSIYGPFATRDEAMAHGRKLMDSDSSVHHYAALPIEEPKDA